MAFRSSRERHGITGRTAGHSKSRGGRYQGQGTFRGRKVKPTFDSARVAHQDEEDGAEDSEDLPDNSPSGSESSSGTDGDILPITRSYAALMQSFTEGSSRSKRRKLERRSEIKTLDDPGTSFDSILDDDYDENFEKFEEDPETTADDLNEANDVDDFEDALDPFQNHFAEPDMDEVHRRIEYLKENHWQTQKISLPRWGRVVVGLPETVSPNSIDLRSSVGLSELKLKQKLLTTFSKLWSEFGALEGSLASPIFNYQDLLFAERTPENGEALRRLACLHAVNHVFKTRDRVIKNNARIAKADDNVDLELRDQGFTRPKILFLLPTRESCVRVIKMITSICEPEQQENRKRFDESYIDKSEKFSEEKADDFRELFGGNDDDMFRLGLKFTRKTIKYFSQFYSSDIIFASPLGLRMALDRGEDKIGDYDFLSSIELVIVDQADALLMQNWEHVEYVFDHINSQPKAAHGCDFSRVRHWYLDDNAKYFRQTIAFAAFNTPELNTLFFNKSKNWAGKVKINAIYPGVIQELGLRIRQTFSRLESPAFITDPDSRFAYFTATIIPSLMGRTRDSNGTVILIPSYLDFVRVRNYFSTSQTTTSLSFGSISEYSSVRDVARARSHFFSGRHSVLLYTERAHHFRRYQIRGVRRLIMYGLPDNPRFYREMVGEFLTKSVQEGKLGPAEGTVRVIFSKWDLLKLERIVGSDRVGKMIKEKGDTFDFL